MSRHGIALLLLAVLLGLPVAAVPAATAVPPRRAGRQAVPTLALRVLRRLPHDPAAFTEGLVLHAGVLYESTGRYGESSLRRVDPESGRVLARANLNPRLFGEGLALCGRGRAARLVQLTWREGRILVYDPRTLRQTGAFPLRGEGWGLACRGHELVMSDGSARLRWLDPATLRETGRTLSVRDAGRPVARLNELEWVNGWIVADIWQEDRAAVIDPRDGRVAAWLDLAPLRAHLAEGAGVANGVAYDARTSPNALLLTGKNWDAAFFVALPRLLRTAPRGARAGA